MFLYNCFRLDIGRAMARALIIGLSPLIWTSVLRRHYAYWNYLKIWSDMWVTLAEPTKFVCVLSAKQSWQLALFLAPNTSPSADHSELKKDHVYFRRDFCLKYFLTCMQPPSSCLADCATSSRIRILQPPTRPSNATNSTKIVLQPASHNVTQCKRNSWVKTPRG